MQRVELVEDGDVRPVRSAAPHTDQQPDHPATPSRRRRPRRRTWLATTALALAAALALGTQSVLDARERDHAARLAAIDDVILPLPEHPTVRWEMETDGPDGWADGWSYGTQAGDHVVTAVVHDRRYDVRAWTRETRSQVWRASGDLTVDLGGREPHASCRSLPGAGAVACVLENEIGFGAATRDAQVVVLDARRGDVRATWTTRWDGWDVTDDEIVGATATRATGSVTWSVARTDLAGHRTSTATVGPIPLLDAGSTEKDDTAYLGPGPSFAVSGDTVALADEGQAWVVTGGTARRVPDVSYRAWVGATRGGAVEVQPIDASTQSWSPRLVLASGKTLTPAGDPIRMVVDDDSEPDLVLLTTYEGSKVQAIDARTGDVRWTGPAAGWGSVVLDGYLYTWGDAALHAVDLRDGSQVWTQPYPGGDAMLFTDGRELYAQRGAQIYAYDLRTGRPGTTRVLDRVPGAGDDTYVSPWLGLLMTPSDGDGDTSVIG